MPEVLVVTQRELPPQLRRQLEEAVIAVLAAHDREEGATIESAPRGGGWTVQAARELLRLLESNGRRIHAQVLREAAGAGGRVSRQRMYEIAGYGEDRSLKGWSRPITRLVEQMRATAWIAGDAVVPLVPEYDSQRLSYQKARGFLIPEDAVSVFAEAAHG